MTNQQDTSPAKARNLDDQKRLIPWYSPGFFEKKATVREFMLLLFGTVSLYLWLHLSYFAPPRSSRNITEEINKVHHELDQVLAQKSSQNPKSSTDTNASPSSTASAKDLSIKSLNQLNVNLQNILKNNQNFNQYSQELEVKITSLNKDSTLIDKPETITNIQTLLKKIEGSFQDQGFFWDDEKKRWLEVIFWSLFGTLIYLIRQPAEYYIRTDGEENNEQSQPKIASKLNDKDNKTKLGECADHYLIRRKPQYYLLLLQSPFLTLVILFVLRATQFSIAGVSLGLNLVAPEVFISLAFILGLYNQVALRQLEAIVATIFTDAYKQSVRKIDIDPYIGLVEYGAKQQFIVIPDVKVRWSIWSQPMIGVIDASTGMYIAPPLPGYTYDKDGNIISIPYKKQEENNTDPSEQRNEAINPPLYQQVVVRAEREDDPMISSLAMVTLTLPNNGSLSPQVPSSTTVK